MDSRVRGNDGQRAALQWTSKVPDTEGPGHREPGYDAQKYVSLFYCLYDAHTVQRHVIEKDEVHQVAVVGHDANCLRHVDG